MSVEADVRAAVGEGQPGRALLILARAVDALLERPVEATGLNPWLLPDPEAIKVEAEWDAAAARAEYNRQLAALGDRPTDAEEARSWDARRSLLGDLLNKPTPNIGVAVSKVVTVPLGGDRFTVTVPDATPEVRAKRHQFALTIGLGDPNWWTKADCALDPKEALDAYVKGGPVWLHAFDRDFVMQLPPQARQWMVQDVETFSPSDAHDLARDILKDTTADGGKDSVLEDQAARAGLPRDAGHV